jgi:hypothetical protein
MKQDGSVIKFYICLAQTGQNKVNLENPQQRSIRSPSRASSRTRSPMFPTRKRCYEAICANQIIGAY